MASINDVYGKNYETKAYESKIISIINNIGRNLGNEHYRFSLNDINEIFQGESMPTNVINALLNKVNKSDSIIIRHINKLSNEINMIPIFILNSPVEYFYIIDKKKKRAYFIYITPTEVNAY